MSVKEKLKNTPAWVWKLIGAIGTIAGFLVSLTQLSDYYWNKVDNLVKGSVTQSTLRLTEEISRTERSIGYFLVDSIQFRIIVVEDEINEYKNRNEKVPLHLQRQLRILKDQLEEAKERWKK